MKQTMRWYGPNDTVRLSVILQSGCSEVVSALHQVPVGDVWEKKDILERKKIIKEAGLGWTVVESLPVHEDIKKRTGEFQKYIVNYKQSLMNLASCGLEVITYNFMPVMDWLRTNPFHVLPNGARTLKFEKLAFIAFDLFLLERPNAAADYSEEETQNAKEYLEGLESQQKEALFKNVLLGLPGSDIPFTPEEILTALKAYEHIDSAGLKEHLFLFLKEIVPVAEELGLKLAIHPDDPPYPVLGLPRIVSTEKDAEEIINCSPLPANGLCFCTGSFGARPDNDLPRMLRKFGDHVHFLHLRNTKRYPNGDFEEADHLNGDTDMVAIVKEALAVMKKREISIPMRPDHGHQMLDDLDKKAYPGYTAIGRLKGLAEIRGLELGLIRSMKS